MVFWTMLVVSFIQSLLKRILAMCFCFYGYIAFVTAGNIFVVYSNMARSSAILLNGTRLGSGRMLGNLYSLLGFRTLVRVSSIQSAL